MKDQSFAYAAGSKRDLTQLIACLSAFPRDLALKVTWGEYKKPRSDAQNNALFGLAYATLSEFTGHTAPELHDMFLRAFYGEIEAEVMGFKTSRPRRTTTTDENGKRSKLTTQEFSQFYEFVQERAASIGCYIDAPDPRYSEFKEMREAR